MINPGSHEYEVRWRKPVVSERHLRLSEMPGRSLDYVLRGDAIRMTHDPTMREALRATQLDLFKVLRPEERVAVNEFIKWDNRRQTGIDLGLV